MNTYLSNKLKILSLIAMVLVVFIHSYIETTTNNTLMSEAIAFLQYFISQGVARVAVPIFFTISGYLYFLSYQNTTNDYIIKTKKRLKTLVLPYLLMSFFIHYLFKFLKVYFIFILVLLWLPITSFSFYIFSNEAILFFFIRSLFNYPTRYFVTKKKRKCLLSYNSCLVVSSYNKINSQYKVRY